MTPLIDAIREVVEEANQNELIIGRLKGTDILLEIESDEGERALIRISGDGVRILKPDVRVSGKREVLEKILKGEGDIMKLFLLGKIKFRGNPALAFTIYERLKEFLSSKKRP